MNTDVNEAEMIDAVWWVEEQAELPPLEREWDQGDYACDVRLRNRFERTYGDGLYRDPNVCGTTYCVAGYIAAKHGWKPTKIHPGDGTTAWVTKNGEDRHTDNVAAEILGITDGAYYELFRGGNDADDIRKIAEDILEYEIPPRPVVVAS